MARTNRAHVHRPTRDKSDWHPTAKDRAPFGQKLYRPPNVQLLPSVKYP
jgi:hypothetical protein